MAIHSSVTTMPRGHQTWAPGTLLVYLLAGAGATAVGILTVYGQKILLITILALLGILAVFAIAAKAGLSRPRVGDVLIVTTIIYLPIAPSLKSYGVAFSALRFVFAATIATCLLLRIIPLRNRALSHGGWIILVFAAYQLIPLLTVGLTSYGLLRYLNWVMFIPLAFISYDDKGAKFAFGGIIVTATLLFLGLILQRQGILGGVWGGESNGDLLHPVYAHRYTSFLGNPNDLGLFMLCAALLLYLSAVQTERSSTVRILAVAMSLMAVYAMFLASSRGAFLALPLVFLFYFVIGARRAWLIAVTVAFIAVVVVDPLVPSVHTGMTTAITSVENVVAGNDVSSSARLTGWGHRLSHAGNIVLGAGYGGYAQGANADASRTDERQQLYHQLTVDNGWLKLWLEEGIVGILIFAAIIGYLISNSIRSRMSPLGRLVGLMTAGVAVAMTFRAFSVDLFDINPWNSFIWLIFGLSASFTGSAHNGAVSGHRRIAANDAPSIDTSSNLRAQSVSS